MLNIVQAFVGADLFPIQTPNGGKRTWIGKTKWKLRT